MQSVAITYQLAIISGNTRDQRGPIGRNEGMRVGRSGKPATVSPIPEREPRISPGTRFRAFAALRFSPLRSFSLSFSILFLFFFFFFFSNFYSDSPVRLLQTSAVNFLGAELNGARERFSLFETLVPGEISTG